MNNNKSLYGLHCLEACTAYLTVTHCKNYELIFYENLVFDYSVSDMKILRNLFINTTIISNCERWFGLRLLTNDLVQDLNSLYSQSDPKDYHIAKLNSKACYWLRSYQSKNSPHMVILLSKQQDYLLVIDPLFHPTPIKILTTDFDAYYEGHLIARFISCHTSKVTEMPETLYHYLLNLSPIINYSNFLRDFSQVTSVNEFLGDTPNFIESFSYSMTYRLPGLRRLFVVFLKWFLQHIENNSRLPKIASLGDIIADTWEVTASIVQKISLLGNLSMDYKQTLEEQFQKISRLENDLRLELLDLLSNDSYQFCPE